MANKLILWDSRSLINIVPVVVDDDDNEVTHGQPTQVSLADLAAYLGGDGGLGGGVESVVAGTGIDVDNTDPANPVVSTSA